MNNQNNQEQFKKVKKIRYNAHGDRMPDYLDNRRVKIKRKFSRSVSRERINDVKRFLN